MIDYKYADLFLEGSTDKQMSLAFSGGETITNESIVSESMSIKESICSEEQLTFGCCEASEFKITIANSFVSHIGQRVTVSAVLDGNEDEPFVYGTYIVTSDNPTADRIHREITAYDDMYTIINADMADWYNELLPDEDSTVTLKEFRDSFFEYFGIEQEDVELVNDDMTVEKTISPSTLSGLTVINAICEINGCFGHISRTSTFQYIMLEPISGETGALADIALAGLARAGTTGDEYVNEVGSSYYIECDYEDYEVPNIDGVLIRQEEGDVGGSYLDGEDNCYVIEDNFLVYGKDEDELAEIAENVYCIIAGLSYRPAEISVLGNPCYEVGDGILLSTTYQEVRTYILQRTLTGIQALRDAFVADGTEEYAEDLNSLESSIVQLKGKTNTLTRTMEETLSQISDMEEGFTSTIKQTATSILNQIAGSSTTWDGSGYDISETSYGTPDEAGLDAAKYEGLYYLDQSTGYVYLSDGTAWAYVDALPTMVDTISASLVLSVEEETDEDGITHKYGALSGEAEYIKFTARQFIVDAGNFSIDEEGATKAGNFTIGENALYSGEHSEYNSDADGVYVGTDYISVGSGGKTFFKADGTGEIGGLVFDKRSRIYCGTDSFDSEEDGMYISARPGFANSTGIRMVGSEFTGAPGIAMLLPNKFSIQDRGDGMVLETPAVTAEGHSFMEWDYNGLRLGLGDTTLSYLGCGGELMLGGFTVPKIQHGSLSISSITTSAWTSFSVTFSTEFESTPDVAMSVRHLSAAAHYVKLGSVSTTGFTGYYYASNGTSVVIHWTAMC